MTDITEFAKVVSVGPEIIEVEISSTDQYEALDDKLQIGSYIQIADDLGSALITVVQGFRIKDSLGRMDGQEVTRPRFVLSLQPVGRLEDGQFKRGGKQITIPPQRVSIASADLLTQIYGAVAAEKRFCFGRLAQDQSVEVAVDGDRFFGKHIGVVGSTGSGKSSTVAAILQRGIEKSDGQAAAGILNNAHIIVFDLHGEYSAAFPQARQIGADRIKLPYWLMNSEELEEMFIESNEQNSHNQVSQFRNAVIENKKFRNPQVSPDRVSYDSPIYFSLEEVTNYLRNLNAEVISRLPGENQPKLTDGSLVPDRSARYFESQLDFIETSTSTATKATNGPFAGEFNRFLMRLEARRNDRRLDFLLSPQTADGGEYVTDDLRQLIEQFVGYGDDESNVTILDLSGIPFEVLSVVVSLVTRLVFTFSFHFKRHHRADGAELPILLVYEEAHNYVPRSDGAKYTSVKKAIERVAKEGRKYGLSLMIVSQRPSEISETVFSQCNNFVVMRLTNPVDQQYVRRLMPDNMGAITDSLSTLEQREAILVGDSVVIPSLVRVDEIVDKPASNDVAFHTEWRKDWFDEAFVGVIEHWRD